jgi:hypothetical protein
MSLEIDDLSQIVEMVKEDLKNERSSEEKNANFVQVYRKNMRAFRGIIHENPLAAEIFYFLLENMDYGNSLACSSSVLQEITGASRTSIWRAVKFLQEKNHISISKMGNCNVYHVNAEVAWTTWGNGKKYAKFKATVLIGESEQDDSIEVKSSKKAKVKEGFYEER